MVIALMSLSGSPMLELVLIQRQYELQPAGLKAQARAVVETTSVDSGYIESLRSALMIGMELHLIAGANSRDDWHVPKDIEEAAWSVTLLHGAGHLMMLESPSDFARAVLNALTPTDMPYRAIDDNKLSLAFHRNS